MARRRSAGRPRTNRAPQRGGRGRRKGTRAVVPGSVPSNASGPAVPREDPHAHMVCRQCGRIADVALNELDLHLLSELGERHPPGWSVDGITFSLTGRCPKCRAMPGP